MRSITRDDLERILRNIHGSTPVTLVTITYPAVKKTGLLSGKTVEKWSRRNCIIGFIYGNSVNYQRERENKTPDFTALPRKWGQRIQGTPLVEHNGNVYLETKVQRVLDSQYVVDGRFVADYEVEPHLRAGSGDDGRQDLENPVVLRDFKLENIMSVNMFGESYVVHDGES